MKRNKIQEHPKHPLILDGKHEIFLGIEYKNRDGRDYKLHSAGSNYYVFKYSDNGEKFLQFVDRFGNRSGTIVTKQDEILKITSPAL